MRFSLEAFIISIISMFAGYSIGRWELLVQPSSRYVYTAQDGEQTITCTARTRLPGSFPFPIPNRTMENMKECIRRAHPTVADPLIARLEGCMQHAPPTIEKR